MTISFSPLSLADAAARRRARPAVELADERGEVVVELHDAQVDFLPETGGAN